MGKFLGMVEESTEVSNTEKIDEKIFKEFLSKGSLWDFHNISREEYSTKSNPKKELLILKFYNEISKGKSFIISLCFHCLYFHFHVLFFYCLQVSHIESPFHVCG